MKIYRANFIVRNVKRSIPHKIVTLVRFHVPYSYYGGKETEIIRKLEYFTARNIIIYKIYCLWHLFSKFSARKLVNLAC